MSEYLKMLQEQKRKQKPPRKCIALGLWEGPKGSVNTRRFFNQRSLEVARKIKCNVGAWKLTGEVDDYLDFEEIKMLVHKAAPFHREYIVRRLEQMGAILNGSARLSQLKPTQYQTFYNFLNTLK